MQLAQDAAGAGAGAESVRRSGSGREAEAGAGAAVAGAGVGAGSTMDVGAQGVETESANARLVIRPEIVNAIPARNDIFFIIIPIYRKITDVYNASCVVLCF